MTRPGALVVGAAVGLAVLLLGVDAFVAESRTVSSSSMAPTLSAGERIVVRKAGVDRWDVPRGTVVVVDAADLWAARGAPGGTVFVKRVIGIGGDHVRCCTPSGQLVRNGTPLVEPYVVGGTDQVPFDVVVPEGHYWLMGDNRQESADARDHLGDPGGGSVPASRMIGSVVAVAWPPSQLRRMRGDSQ